mgnify:FL=1
MTEYSSLDTSLWLDTFDRSKKQTYHHIDDKLLRNNSPRELIHLILSDRYLWKIEKVNQKTLDKISNSLKNFNQFKQTIQILPYELFILMKEDFLNIVAELSRKDRIDQEDYDLMNDKYNISKEDIINRQEQLNSWRLISDISNNVSKLLNDKHENIKPHDNLRKFWKVSLKIRTTQSDEVYNKMVEDYIKKTEWYTKITEIFRLEKQKNNVIKFFKLLIEFNPDLFYNNAIIDWQWTYSVSVELLDLIKIFINIKPQVKENFKEEAINYSINPDIFFTYIYTTPWSIIVKEILSLWLKRETYRLNQDLFKNLKKIHESK